MRAPAIDQRVHRLEPAPGEHRQAGHLVVVARELRRLVPVLMLQERIAPTGRAVMVGMPLDVVVEPVGELVVGVPGVPRLDPLESAIGQPDAPQSVVLDVVDELHREDHAKAQDGVDDDRPCAAHPIGQRVPQGGLDPVTPERIRVVPGRQLTASQPVALEMPGTDEVAPYLPGKVPPEALTLGSGAKVRRGADQRVMDVDVFRGVSRVGDGRQQEFAESALPDRAPVDQFVADDKDRLAHARQHARHQRDFPGGQVAGDQDLPEGEHECHRPECRPGPDGQLVPEQVAFERLLRLHVPLFRAEHGVERVGESQVDERPRDPPAALSRGEEHQRKNHQRHEVRQGVPEGRLDHPRASGRSSVRTARLRHGDLPPLPSVRVWMESALFPPGRSRSRLPGTRPSTRPSRDQRL